MPLGPQDVLSIDPWRAPSECGVDRDALWEYWAHWLSDRSFYRPLQGRREREGHHFRRVGGSQRWTRNGRGGAYLGCNSTEIASSRSSLPSTPDAVWLLGVFALFFLRAFARRRVPCVCPRKADPDPSVVCWLSSRTGSSRKSST